jgi:DNA processing protein
VTFEGKDSGFAVAVSPPSDQAGYWLTLTQAPGLGPTTIAKLVGRFGSAEAVCVASPAALEAAGLKRAAVASLQAPDRQRLDAALEWAEQEQAHILTPDSPAYPPALRELPSAPPVLFVRGDPAVLAEPQLAIVGSRHPTPGGVEITRSFARHLAGLGLVITSGLALGVDRAAHEGALENGRTVAVLGTGPDRVYPAAHRELAHRVVAQGALVTELPPGTGPEPRNFPRRNRIISALTLGTLVTEAALESGSLITARYAAEQGREVFAIPGSIHNPVARGCHRLIRQGAKLVDSVEHILEELEPQLRPLLDQVPCAAAVAPVGASPGGGDGLDPDHRRLLDAMGWDPIAPDELIARSGLPAQGVASMLLLLELTGHVSSHPGGRYSRCGNGSQGGV